MSHNDPKPDDTTEETICRENHAAAHSCLPGEVTVLSSRTEINLLRQANREFTSIFGGGGNGKR